MGIYGLKANWAWLNKKADSQPLLFTAMALRAGRAIDLYYS